MPTSSSCSGLVAFGHLEGPLVLTPLPQAPQCNCKGTIYYITGSSMCTQHWLGSNVKNMTKGRREGNGRRRRTSSGLGVLMLSDCDAKQWTVQFTRRHVPTQLYFGVYIFTSGGEVCIGAHTAILLQCCLLGLLSTWPAHTLCLTGLVLSTGVDWIYWTEDFSVHTSVWDNLCHTQSEP